MGFGTPYMRFVRLDMGFINLTDIGYLETYIYVLLFEICTNHIYRFQISKPRYTVYDLVIRFRGSVFWCSKNPPADGDTDTARTVPHHHLELLS